MTVLSTMADIVSKINMQAIMYLVTVSGHYHSITVLKLVHTADTDKTRQFCLVSTQFPNDVTLRRQVVVVVVFFCTIRAGHRCRTSC